MRLLGWLFSSMVLLGGLGIGIMFVALNHFSQDLPDYTQLADYEPPITTRLHAGDGRLMAEYAVEDRLFVPYEAMPDAVIQAFVSAEDQNFWRHPGVDYMGIARATVTNLRNIGSGRRPIGASTITQQVAKNFLLTNELSYERKIREILLAFRIERAFTKERILELYLNQIYLGRGAYGVAAAALNYFDKSLRELELHEAAYLAALPKAPNNYHPTRRTEAAIVRRNYVLGRMLEDGAITPAQAEIARGKPLAVTDGSTGAMVQADYFAEEVRRELQALYGDEALYEGGLSVRTTLEPTLQAEANRALRAGLLAYDRRHGWRGPVTRLDSFDNWPAQLAAVERPAGAGDWEMAVVLEVQAEAVLLGFADRSRGAIAVEGLSWARPWRENQRVGSAPNSADDVLALGDVVLVSEREALVDPATFEATAPPVGSSDDTEAGPPLVAYTLEQVPDIQGALIAMDPHTGRVLAMSGGYAFEMSEFNRATQALRQPGSAFKPFVYLAALDHGYTPSTIVLDTPLAIDQGPGLEMWRPSNYSGDHLGAVPMRVGLEKSRNLMTIRLLQDVGLEPVRDYARTFGIMEDMQLFYSMALGAGETTALQLTNAYAMVVNGGRRIEPTFIDRIQDRNGRTIFRHDNRRCETCSGIAWTDDLAPPTLPDERVQIADPVSAYQLVSMLEGVVHRGTGVRLRAIGKPLAGKTGTTNDAFDTWFVGFSPDLVVGVWVGFDNPRTLGPRETGSSAALPVFQDFMASVLRDEAVPPFRIPPGVNLVRVNPRTGEPAGPDTTVAIWEGYRPGTEPTRRAAGGLGGTGLGDTPSASGLGGLY